MPGVPEFLLRKLFINGSLKQRADGFEFKLNNTLLAVTVTALDVSADGTPIPILNLFLQLSGQKEIPAAFISDIHPIALPLNTPLTVRAVSSGSLPRDLAIGAETNEIGRLKFTIKAKPKIHITLPGFFTKPMNSVRQAALKRRVARNPHHPIYHFTPPANWMNDPNGLISWQGQTHLFYQYNPNGPLWDSIHWGHAVTRDLVHWKRLPVAMAPRKGKPDSDGCWSGSAVITPDGPLFFYTAVFPETVCLAMPDDGLRKLYPSPRNPLIAAPPPGLEVEGFRDPCVWREGKIWYMTVGSGIKGMGGAVLFYRSTDLIHWEYRHPLLTGELNKKKPFPTGFMWECSQLIRLGAKDLLILSAMIAPGEQYVIGYLGKYENETFTPAELIRLDFGGKAFYAPLSFEDDKGRRVMFGWISEEREDEALQEAGWAGALSLPRILSLSPEGELLMEPAQELDMLKGRELFTFSGMLSKESTLLSGVTPIRNACFSARVTPQKSGSVVFCLAASPDAPEQTLITLDFKRKVLLVDTSSASLDPRAHGSVKECPLPVRERVELEVFLDGSILEVYVNKQVTLTTRLYPTKLDDLHLYGYSNSSSAPIIDFQLWEMGSCY
jgi:beta-fructofuranosidase